ncbi:MAG: sigma-70 family RNA polymerase sigma factor [Pseudomonadales bacterium]|nr:sigma-70 family RNA polymerase sigma factor [Pseudomonadales bacterium]
MEPILRSAAGYAYSILRNRDHAQDAVQQAALQGLERLHSFDEARSFRQWWFSILHNCCIDMIRADKSALHVDIDEFDVANPAEATAHHEQLLQGIARLSEKHQEILRLKYFADLGYKEIAAVLAIPQGTVMSRLHLARLALAANMKEDK